MELKTYLRLLFKHWWIVLPTFLVTLAATILFTRGQPAIYSATATYVITPTAEFGDVRAFASGLDTLSRRTEIGTTYGQVAQSRTIRSAVIEELGLSPSQAQGLSIRAEQVAGTNILKVTVEARDPDIAQTTANAVGENTVEYAKNLYEPYMLRSLDPAVRPRNPIKPSPMLNYALGGVFGLALAAGLAFLADYLATPMGSVVALNIIDAETGTYNQDYFQQRLSEEMARAKRQNYTLSVALINVDHMGTLKGAQSGDARAEMLRKVAVFLKHSLREEDLLAYIGDATFALLLPDIPKEAARTLTARLQTRMAWNPFELERSGIKVNLSSAAGIASLDDRNIDRNELMDQARKTLENAGTNSYEQAYPAADDLINQPEGAPQS
jgi:diguanylate cyclase (GGDEF)-like protein